MDDEKILINTDYIKLGQLLKLASLVSQGSDAKTLIVNGYVSVNGETVLERGKKIYPGDLVEVEEFGSVKVEHEQVCILKIFP